MQNDLYICKICGQDIGRESRAHFYKNHKITEENYYIKFFNKKDLFTGEDLEFKNAEQYLLNDFNNKNNLRNFIQSVDRAKTWDYLKNYLLKRKTLKNLVYGPGFLEIKTLLFPQIKYIEKTFGRNSFKKLLEECGLICRFNYQELPNYNQDYDFIICDTREANPLTFDKRKIQKLEFGDYCPFPNINDIFIERKSLTDLLSTLSNGYERFINELIRTRQNDAYLVILIEEPLNNVLGFKFLPHVFSKSSQEFINHRIRDVSQNFANNCQFICVNGRKEASRVIDRLFKMDKIKDHDLQFLYSNSLI